MRVLVRSASANASNATVTKSIHEGSRKVPRAAGTNATVRLASVDTYGNRVTYTNAIGAEAYAAGCGR